MKQRILQIVALLLAVLMLTACAPGAAPAEPAATAQPAATEAPAVTEAPAATEAPAPTEAPAEPAATTEPAPAEPIASEADTWDLTEYFADDAAFQTELETLRDVEYPAYKAMTEAVCDNKTLLETLQHGDELALRLNHLGCYAKQKLSLNATDSAAQIQSNTVTLLIQDVSLIDTAFNNRLLAMDESFWNAVFADEALSPHWRMLNKLRESADYMLSDTEEALLMPAYQAQNNIENTFGMLDYSEIAWETVTDPEGNEVVANYGNYIGAMENPDREYRERFFKAFKGAYGRFSNTFASNLNAFTTLNEQMSVLHNYDSLLHSVTLSNGLTPEIYDALMEAGESGSVVLEREAEIRKAVLGYDKLYSYDLRLPLGNAKAPSFTYTEAQELIKSALAPLGQEYIDTLDTAFTSRWIDVYAAENKDTGAYSGMAIDIHPWVLTNYNGGYDSVSTLAHELGHAVHQYRSFKDQVSVYEKNPTTLVSEVASTFNEQLLSRYMIEHAANDEEKLYYVQQELSTLNNTFFGQIAFADFERKFHKLVENGEALTAETLNELYAQNEAIYYPGYETVEEASSYWAAVPHYYYNYYVYSYAMAISVSCVAADAVYNGDTGMLDSYLKYLSAGDTADASELFKLLSVDVTSPDYTKPLLERYSELLDMEEELLGL